MGIYRRHVKVAGLVLATFYAGFLIYVLGTQHLLPDRVASHFNASGQPNDWMARSTMITLMLGLGTGLCAVFVGIGFLSRFIPTDLWNLPHRDYWLAPERRTDTEAYIRLQLLWLSCGMLLFISGMHYLVIQAHHSTPPHLPNTPFMVILGLFVCATTGWAILILRRFSRPAAGP